MAGRGWRRLSELERIRGDGAPAAVRRKLELLAALERQVLGSASQVRRLHELLCWLRAYPDDAALLARVKRMLAGFGRRQDLRHHRAALASSGIAGTAIHYRFFWPTARWIARRWPGRLWVDWNRLEDPQRLAAVLPALLTWSEARWLGRQPPEALRRILAGLRRRREADGTFLVRRFAALKGDDTSRETLHDLVDTAYELRPGPAMAARTTHEHPGAPIVFGRASTRRERPDLRREARRPPKSIRLTSRAEGERLVDLAREAMITRGRDLDAFAWGEPGDVHVIDDGSGLWFAAIGMVPERRLPVRAAYGYLTLRNGVPIGYMQMDAVDRSVELSFNTFETYRAGEAAWIFARAVAMCRHFFGATAFAIEPYQLGKGNAEGLASGAWWFYYKMGFRPRHPRALGRVERELARLAADPRHRSSVETLERLAEDHLFFDLEPQGGRRFAFFDRLGERVGRELAVGDGGDRERTLDGLAREAAGLLGLRSAAGFAKEERVAWRRWAPIVCMLPGLDGWRREERRALVEVIRAKGRRHEVEFVRRFDRHPKLARALRRLPEVVEV